MIIILKMVPKFLKLIGAGLNDVQQFYIVNTNSQLRSYCMNGKLKNKRNLLSICLFLQLDRFLIFSNVSKN